MTTMLQCSTSHKLSFMSTNPQQSGDRFRSDLQRLWSTVVYLIFGITIGVFCLNFFALTVDIKFIVMSLVVLNSLHAFNLYIIFRNGNKSLQWMAVGEHLSNRIILQEILTIHREAVSNLVHFGLYTLFSLGAAVYYVCVGFWVVVGCWLVFMALAGARFLSAWANWSWSRLAYNHWVGELGDQNYDAVQINDIKTVD